MVCSSCSCPSLALSCHGNCSRFFCFFMYFIDMQSASFFLVLLESFFRQPIPKSAGFAQMVLFRDDVVTVLSWLQRCPDFQSETRQCHCHYRTLSPLSWLVHYHCLFWWQILAKCMSKRFFCISEAIPCDFQLSMTEMVKLDNARLSEKHTIYI